MSLSKKSFENTIQTRGLGTTCQIPMTFDLPEQILQMTHLLMMEDNCAN